MKADRERRENRYDVFTSEDFRLRPVIGHKIIFTGEKNRPTSQIASRFSTDDIYLSNYVIVNLCTYIINIHT